MLVDKLEKVPLDAIEEDLRALGLTKEIVLELVAALQVSSLHVQCKSNENLSCNALDDVFSCD